MAHHLFLKAGGLTLVLAATVIIYSAGLSGPLLLDDSAVFQPLLNLPPGLLFDADTLFGKSGPLGRGVSMFTFSVNTAVHGSEFAAWKATNVFFHVLAGTALFLFLLALSELAQIPGAQARPLSLIVVALWLLHPLNVSTVLYTVQRMTILATLFSFAALAAWCRGRLACASSSRRALAWFGTALLVCLPLAALSKETGLLALYLIVAVELTIGQSSPRPVWLSRFLFAIAVLPLIGFVIYMTADLDRRFFYAYGLRDFTPVERLLTQLYVVFDYLRWIVLPGTSDYGFFHDDVTIVRSLTAEPKTLVLCCLYLGGAILAWALRRRSPMVALGIAWFGIGHSLESTIFGLEIAFEHRNYLPMVGVLLALCAGARQLVAGRAALVLGVSAIVILAFSTYLRSSLWGTSGPLLEHFVRVHPHSDRARQTLSEWHVAGGRYTAAAKVLQPADHEPFFLMHLLIKCLDGSAATHDDVQGLAGVADRKRLSYIELDTLNAISEQVIAGRCPGLRQPLTETLIGVRGQHMAATKRYRLHVHLAKLVFSEGDYQAAVDYLNTAARLKAQDAFVHYLLAEYALTNHDPERARVALEQASRRRGAERYPRVDKTLRSWLEREQSKPD